jgi:nucleotide-binding universal stress UspA family protein
MTTILVGTDSSSAADLAVDDAARLARDRGAELLVLLVRSEGDVRAAVDPDRSPDPDRYLSDLARRFPEVSTTSRIERGEPADRICEVAAEVGADTIVVGNRGTRGSWWRVKDSVPNFLVRR